MYRMYLTFLEAACGNILYSNTRAIELGFAMSRILTVYKLKE